MLSVSLLFDPSRKAAVDVQVGDGGNVLSANVSDLSVHVSVLSKSHSHSEGIYEQSACCMLANPRSPCAKAG